MSARFIVGDVFDALATLPDDSVDLVFSSPPFLALRSYLPADHPDKAKEIGSEATPADFLDTLLDVVEACDRVLAPHGSLCFELGDTFSGSGGGGGDYNEGGLREDAPAFGGSAAAARGPRGVRQGHEHRDGGHHFGGNGWPEAKSLCGIPTLFAWSLAYGRNLLRPERTTPRWRIRNLVVWARSNPPVGALGDKFRPATSYLTVATKSRTRYFDLDAVRNVNDPERMDRTDAGSGYAPADQSLGSGQGNGANNLAGAPPLDYWVIPTHPYPGSHYATFPPELVVKPVKAMCPQKVCRVCGEPSRRITEPTEEYANRPNAGRDFLGADHDRGLGKSAPAPFRAGSDPSRKGAQYETIGWTDCHCHSGIVDAPLTGAEKWRPGTVLDPFGGSGTTGVVATGHGRDCILIDIDARNAELALERVGPMFLTVEYLNAEPAA